MIIRAIERIFETENGIYKRYVINGNDLLQISSCVRHLIDILRLEVASDWENKAPLNAYLKETHMEDDGDYWFDGDDEVWNSNYQEIDTYIPVHFDPVSGEKIEVSIICSQNIQEEFNKCQKNYNEVIKRRHKKQNYDYGREICDKFERLFHDKQVSNEEFQLILEGGQ